MLRQTTHLGLSVRAALVAVALLCTFAACGANAAKSTGEVVPSDADSTADTTTSGDSAAATTDAKKRGDTGVALADVSGLDANVGAADAKTIVDTTGSNDTGDGTTCKTDWSVVSFKTSDGVMLEADYRPATKSGRGAVVLLHMIPPSWNRKSWPLRVRDLLAAGDVAVLSIDRRGAGKSQGVAKDAYIGPGGAKDVAAAIAFLTDPKRPCAASPKHIALVGASNGTTSVLDYTLSHATDAPHPSAMVWLSPGTYTEAQHKISVNRTVLDKLPLLFVHPSSEPWSETWMNGAAATWSFLQIKPGQHGTKLFDDGAMEAKTLKLLLPHIAAATKP